ncbi:MAG: ABC transporter substrate-binding protein [Lachnospiraceae bacterium]|nr:ABC transporter substrate-binding protein [Lachnospiraceae bacterium]
MKKISRRDFLKGSASALAASVVFGSGLNVAAEEGADGTLYIAWTSDMQTMDVHTTSSNYQIPLNIFDRLFEIQLNDDGSTELVNSLVEDYTVSEDGLTYEFTLHEGVLFSDGTPLTSADVKYTFTRMLALPESVQTDFANAIAGSDEVMEGTAEELTGIEVVDDTHFTVTLSEPFAGFLYQLATPSCCIYSESIVEAAGDDYGIDPALTIGTGPYVVTSWDHDNSIILDLNPNYWGETPSVTHIEISIIPDASTMSMMFQSGEIDILDCDYLDSSVVESTYKTAYADQIVSANRLSITYFMLNENVEPLNDVNVRKAIQMAVDRESILTSVYSGDGTIEDGIFPTGLIGHSEENQGWLAYDPEGAKALLEEAGYADGFTMEISSDESASSGVLLVLQIIQQNLADVGITAEIVSYDEASWLALRKSGEMCSFVATWTADYNDPDNFIYTFFGSADKSLIRSGNYYNTEVMERVAAARAIVDDDERLAEYAALEAQIVQEDAAWVPLFSRTHLFVVSDRVASYTPHWAGYSDYSFVGVTLA